MAKTWTFRLTTAAWVFFGAGVLHVEAAPTINSFTANPSTVVSGQTSTLSWNVSNATNVAIGGVGSGLPLVGTFTTPPLTVTTTYQLTATGSGTVSQNATITVTSCVPVAISSQPANKSITSGGSTSLQVSVTGSGPFSYQWFKGSSNSDETNPVAGGTSNSLSVTLSSTTSYWVRVRNCSNANTVKSNVATVTVTAANPSASISSSPGTIVVGDSATLTWSSSNSSSVSIDNGIGPVAASGSMKVYPQATTKYTITAKGSPDATDDATVVVNPAPGQPILATLQFIPNEIQPGGSTTLVWDTSGASSVTISNLGSVALKGERVLTGLSVTATYQLVATGSGGTKNVNVTITVRNVPKPVINTFTATPNSVQVGQPVTLSWASTGGKTATLDGDDVALGGNASDTPTRARAYTYTLVVDGDGGRATKTVSVKVNNATPPAVETPAGQPNQSGSQDGSGGTARFKNPAGVGVDGAGNIFVIDSGNHTIRRISTNGTSETWAGEATVSGFRDGCRSGCPTTSLFNFSNFAGAMLVKSDGSLVVTDASNRIRYVDTSGKVTTCSSASCARFSVGSMAEAKDGSGNRYEVNTGSNTILKVSGNEQAVVFAGDGEAGYRDGPGGTARFNKPRGIAVDRAGNVYVGDTGNNAIRKITADGVVTTLAASSPPPGQVRANGASSARFTFGCCGGQVVVDPTKGTVYVTDTGSNTVKEVTPEGDVTTVVGSGDASSENGSGSQAGFNEPQGGAFTPDGRLVITDTGNHTIRKTSPIIETSVCVPSSSTACMLSSRFRVTLRYRNGFDGSPVDANASVKSVTGFASANFETSFFYFNDQNNIELMVKILDQGNTNSSGQPTIAVLYGSATPLGTELSVVDTLTGATKTYSSTFNSMRGQTDFTAFVK